jgi:hypothetical protein
MVVSIAGDRSVVSLRIWKYRWCRSWEGNGE